jgi:hypothetical protein
MRLGVPFVRPLQRKVEPGIRLVTKAFVILLNLRHEAPTASGQRFDQHVEAIRQIIVGDVLETPAVPMFLRDEMILGVVAGESATEARDVGQIVEDDVENTVFGKHPARLEARIHLPAQYVVDLRFMEQKKLLHAQILPGNGSIVAGNAAATSPRGIVFLSSCSCFRALSYLIRT